ncbi:MAG: hypothetical protein HC780_26885 [Leptolyngbyaceae cyanobacterium CSU_1_3]|nr:hypothetical protein [Leptolyngbyaceae cyanobacterium CSU_1_3]
MPDQNRLFLQHAAHLLNELEIRYLEADFDEQVYLKDDLDQAMSDFSKAKLAILKKTVTCTSEDVKQMRQLRQRMSNAPNFPQIVSTIASFASFVRSRFL